MGRQPVSRYSIVPTGLRRSKGIRSTEPLTAADFDAIARDLGTKPRAYWKIAPVAARQASSETEVVTKWEGESTRNVAKPGDWIVTNLDANGRVMKDRAGNPNQYVIDQDRFPELYEQTIGATEFGPIFCPITKVDAVSVPGALDIRAPWGERQTMTSGYLLSNGKEVYGVTRNTFEATYEAVPDAAAAGSAGR